MAKRVAIVVVHGVSDQTAGESADAIADLLLSDGRLDPQYSAFHAHSVRIPVRPVIVTMPSGHGDEPFQHESRKLHQRAVHAQAGDTVDHVFARGQLTIPAGTLEDVYQTVRQSGERVAAPRVGVDIFEMYWADLSRLGTGFLRIFGELYQILFHVGSLGKHVTAAAQAEHPGDTAWARFADTQAKAVWWLSTPIPILNLCLLGMAAVMLAAGGVERLSGNKEGRDTVEMILIILPWAVVAIAAIVIGSLWGAGMLIRRWLAVLGVMLVPAVAIVLGRGAAQPATLLALEMAAGGAFLFVALMQAYERRRPGVAAWGLPIGAGVLLIFVLRLPVSELHPAINAALTAVSVILALLSLSWLMFVGQAWRVFIHGGRARSSSGSSPGVRTAAMSDRARRTVWSARLFLALPALAIFILTVVFWATVVSWSETLLPDDVYRNVRALLESGAGDAFVPILGAAAIALACTFVALGPISWLEVRPRRPRSVDMSRRVGRWLTGAFRFLTIPGWLVVLSLGVLFPLGVAGAARLLSPLAGVPGAGLLTQKTLVALGTLIVGSGIGLTVLRGRLDSLALGFRPVVDLLFDVDNHLREHPLGANPKVRIFARYVSLLRHICTATQDDGQSTYGAVVIVAHSQGTVISADLLRFLWQEREPRMMTRREDGRRATVEFGRQPDAALARFGHDLPVYLFTMGCPLRQLYGLRFPNLYQWAHHSAPWSPGERSPIPDDRQPDPCELDVTRWVNAYRSGDYVGRHLWRTDLCEDNWDFEAPAAEDSCGSRRELCIGPGAHTHYWDAYAPEVRLELDRLVVQACGGASWRTPAAGRDT